MLGLETILIAAALAAPPAAEASAGGPPSAQERKALLHDVGAVLARSLASLEVSEEELEEVVRGMRDAQAGNARVQPDEVQKRVQAVVRAKQARDAERQQAIGPAFLVRQASLEGASRTDSGVVIVRRREGDGPHPKPVDTVRVRYVGKLADGAVFDREFERDPATFALGQTIPCWREAIPLLRVGARAEITCPSILAYGPPGRPPLVPGDAVLHFDVELVGTDP
jgi:FKBP-type peptidyl-prolyl cis-trans isomerase